MQRDRDPERSAARPEPPQVSLPKGGGAIRGIGEKFGVNPANGTASLQVPLPLTPGRSGFGPSLSLSYDSGAGNGPFGFGWTLSLPAIARKTDKGLPQYRDEEESDVFLLSGAEDLVPVLVETAAGWVPEPVPDRVIGNDAYRIRRYRPRIEGLFARIERWTDTRSGIAHWRTISRDNVTTVYGKDANSRIRDPANLDPARVFAWLICESYDDRGNAIVYRYKAEDSLGVDASCPEERNRDDTSRSANRYLKSVRYGNRLSRRVEPDPANAEWLFEVVLDYGEHDPGNPKPDDAGDWQCRADAFSSYRAGFEIRTYRLCRRVLMFHHFPLEAGVGSDCLVRASELAYRTGPSASFITSIQQCGFKRRAAGGYVKRCMPPLEFRYSEAVIAEEVRELDPQSIENLPSGTDGYAYQWVDLDGEGLSGILTEQAQAWFYKPNLGDGRFGALRKVAPKPSLAALGGGRQQLVDLAGDGQLDLVEFGGPTPGFFERTHEESWETFKRFLALPEIAWNDPNLRFVDLDGDGRADILVTEDEVLTWHPSLGEEGFGAARKVRKPLDEELGPRLVLADGEQSIYLADMSGDGLSDLVRIRNGEVCYWPNVGYGRFGAKVTMGDSPWFDAPDQFDQRRVRLADIDGTGANDIIYLGRDGVRLYFNESGNRWRVPRLLKEFSRTDNLSSVAAVDLLGNGTACLVWSSPLPGDTRHRLRYIDLMGGTKPRLLVGIVNNLGAATELEYAASTGFYLADKRAGKPWISRLPFPVHCVKKVVVTDKWRRTRFATSYSYHHGYFDGVEREFRGFGRVDQLDTESFGEFAQGNIASHYIIDSLELYQPPVKTVTWYHTGAGAEGERILAGYAGEYFSAAGFAEKELAEADIDPGVLSAEEWSEARRACKGMALRQETYELDVDAMERGEHRPVRLFSAVSRSSHVRRLQPRLENRHAVFFVAEGEALTYHYELDLRQTAAPADPRISHTLNLSFDERGNLLESVAAAYPRIGSHSDPLLPAAEVAMIDGAQKSMHLARVEHRYTTDYADADNHRIRVPCETRTYELAGVAPSGAYFTLEELRGVTAAEIPYHQIPSGAAPQKRLVERTRTLFFDANLSGPLAFGYAGRLALPYETYTLALTEVLLAGVLGNKLTDDVRATLDDPTKSGYLGGPTLAARFPDLSTAGQYWLRSGTAGFASDAADHFYLPERFADPFGNVTVLQYDGNYDLFIRSSTDAAQNTTQVEAYDFRVLAPSAMKDINDNLSEVYFDVLGMPVATALKGKGNEGDSLAGFDDALANPNLESLVDLCTADYDETEPRRLLASATARHVYYFGQTEAANGDLTWAAHPPYACGIVREKHVARLATGEKSPIQVAFGYSDGMGTVIVTKTRAEPAAGETALRWIASGKTILNNKGKAVKQYEPYFSESGQRFAEPREVGVTPLMYYDAAGRLVRVELPDGSFSRVEFSPWYAASYDANDTVLEPGNAWYARNSAASASPEEKRAATLAAAHAGTPAAKILDSLGRDVIAIAHNRGASGTGTQDEKHLTFTKLDAEGKPLWIRDARRNLVMQYIQPPMADGQQTDATSGFIPCYDIAGNLLFQHGMDGGDRWMLPNAAGNPMIAWDFNQHQDQSGAITGEARRFTTRYDALRRPIEQWLEINGGAPQLVERYAYGEHIGNVADAKSRNLRGRLHRQHDPSGLSEAERLDFKGNPLEERRSLASQYKAPVVDWQSGSTTGLLETETFVRVTEYDALNRVTRLYNWHLGDGSRVAVYEPSYNPRGLLVAEDVVVRALKTGTGYTENTNYPRTQALRELRYDAKGQKELLRLGNGTTTSYDYDPATFRLKRLRTTRPAADDLQDLHYTYDPVGNITEIRDDAFEPTFFNNQSVEAASKYTYDALYRITEGRGRENYHATDAPAQFEAAPFSVQFPLTDPNTLRNYTQTYAYDGAGNILQMKHAADRGSWTRHYTYGATNNRLASTWEGSNTAGAVQYRYDSHGNTLNLANVAVAQSIRWDYRDMIRAFNLQGGGWSFYNYDPRKQRSRKVIENQNGVKQWERLYLGGAEIYRRYAGGAVVEEIESHPLFEGGHRLLLIDDVLQTNNANQPSGPLYRYQYSNHLGSVSVEVDEQMRLISYEEYHTYGTTAYRARNGDIEAPPKRYRYSGMERDEESGLAYHSARCFVPWLGRWTSTDPLGLDDGLNLYGFVAGNPLRMTDRRGTGGEETKEVKPRVIAELEHRHLPYATEVQFDVLDAQGKTIASGAWDVITIDPRDSRLIIPELKGKNLNALTKPNQPIYVPILESAKGATVRITGQKGGILGLEKGALRHISGENYLRVGVRNLTDFLDALRLVTGGEPVKHAFLDKSGKYHLFKTTEEFRQFLETTQRAEVLGYKTTAAAAKAKLLPAAAATEAKLAPKVPALEAKSATKIAPTESKTLAKTGLREAQAVSPGDANLGGLNEYGDVQQEAATTGVESASFLSDPLGWLFGTASNALAGQEGAPKEDPAKKKTAPKRRVAPPPVDPNEPLYPYQYDPGY